MRPRSAGRWWRSCASAGTCWTATARPRSWCRRRSGGRWQRRGRGARPRRAVFKSWSPPARWPMRRASSGASTSRAARPRSHTLWTSGGWRRRSCGARTCPSASRATRRESCGWCWTRSRGGRSCAPCAASGTRPRCSSRRSAGVSAPSPIWPVPARTSALSPPPRPACGGRRSAATCCTPSPTSCASSDSRARCCSPVPRE